MSKEQKVLPEEQLRPGPWFLLQGISNWDTAAMHIIELQTENRKLQDEVIKLKNKLRKVENGLKGESNGKTF